MVEHGFDNIQKFLDDELDDFKKAIVNIAITGQSGQGKSSMINCLRNMTAQSEGAAKVGVTETTMESTPYPHPKIPNVIMWDMPGFNTKNFQRNTYLERMKFSTFDAVIICGSVRFTQDDMWIAEEAQKIKMPFYIVRTKIDMDVSNDKEDNPNHNEQKLLADVRYEISGSLQEGGLHADKIYLISTRPKNSAQWDYPSFTQELIKKTPVKNQEVLILALNASSKTAIAQKKKVMLKRMPEVCLSVAAAETVEGKKAVILKEQRLYEEAFGLTIQDMKAQGMDRLTIQDMSDIIGGIGEAITSGFAGFAVGGIFGAIAGAVSAVANAANNIVKAREKAKEEERVNCTNILSEILDQYENKALKVLKKVVAARSS